MSDIDNININSDNDKPVKRKAGRPRIHPKIDRVKTHIKGRPIKIKTQEEIDEAANKRREFGKYYYTRNKKIQHADEIDEFDTLRERILDSNINLKSKILFRIIKLAKQEGDLQFMKNLQIAYVHCS